MLPTLFSAARRVMLLQTQAVQLAARPRKDLSTPLDSTVLHISIILFTFVRLCLFSKGSDSQTRPRTRPPDFPTSFLRPSFAGIWSWSSSCCFSTLAPISHVPSTQAEARSIRNRGFGSGVVRVAVLGRKQSPGTTLASALQAPIKSGQVEGRRSPRCLYTCWY